MSESTSQLPLQAQIPAYTYADYKGDDDIEAFFYAYNQMASAYLAWANATPLAVYTNPTISGGLLDWIGQGIYGLIRPVISSQVITRLAGYNTVPYNTLAYNAQNYSSSGNAAPASDDVYKRFLTWHLYEGDGPDFSILWLKKRIARFLYGQNGTDPGAALLDSLPSVTVSNGNFQISFSSTGSIAQPLNLLLKSNLLALPFQYTFELVDLLTNLSGVLNIQNASSAWPTSTTGLSAGDLWDNAGVVSVYGTTTPSPTAPAVYFNGITSASLLALGGANLPLTNPGVGTGQLWNNGGPVNIA